MKTRPRLRSGRRCLAAYGREARDALPRLLAMKDVTNASERYCVQETLKRIDPAMAGQLGLK